MTDHLPNAAVERLVRCGMVGKWADPQHICSEQPPGDFPDLCALCVAEVKSVLTAALRLDDPETVERVAKALYDEFHAGPVWDDDGPIATHYGNYARVAIRAFLDGGDGHGGA